MSSQGSSTTNEMEKVRYTRFGAFAGIIFYRSGKMVVVRNGLAIASSLTWSCYSTDNCF
jgi:hypothetical protein